MGIAFAVDEERAEGGEVDAVRQAVFLCAACALESTELHRVAGGGAVTHVRHVLGGQEDLEVGTCDLTLGLPPAVTAATGVDAMVHAIEAYTSKSANNNPISRMLAVQALDLLGANIHEAVHNGTNREARANMLLGSMLAGQAFANSPVAAVHALAYPVGSLFHVPHGLSNALVLAEVMRFNAPSCATLYAELAPHVFPDIQGSNADEITAAFIDRLVVLNADLGLESGLRGVGISEADVDKLASDAMNQTRLLVNNPRDVTEEDARNIYRASL